MASILGDGTGPGSSGSSRCLLLLQRSLAIQLTRGPPFYVTNTDHRESPKEHPADEMWMYDKGYNLFQMARKSFVVIHTATFVYEVKMFTWAFFIPINRSRVSCAKKGLVKQDSSASS
ncbi:uncharacterized protein LOC109861751 [Pseudomyrmex gracilis]|uniref:uncharacterized protein LOC109861751 n=1 Tax=Pseudomyrmex gracilis TaxID=219809 RepID=UPI000995855E|nr:uncharacterized protein LOC109861751 [Pseudomyrmex gracilis]